MIGRIFDGLSWFGLFANLSCEGRCPDVGTNSLVMGAYEVTYSDPNADVVGGTIVLDGDHNAVLTYEAEGVEHTVAYWWGPE
jgi:hypothetical protein